MTHHSPYAAHPEHPGPQQHAGQQPPAHQGQPRRRAPRVLLSGLLALAAVAVTAGYVYWQTDGADRTVRTELWQAEKKVASKKWRTGAEDGRQDNPLSRQLLKPTDARAYGLGPDVEGYGNDFALSGRRAAAVLKEGGKGLPPQERRLHGDFVEQLDVQGMAMRSYATGREVVTIQIAQMDNEEGVLALQAGQRQLFESLGDFREGPDIEGKDAECFLPPRDEEAGMDQMYCSAARGNLMIQLNAYGGDPFEPKDVAMLFEKQLDQAESPGKSI